MKTLRLAFCAVAALAGCHQTMTEAFQDCPKPACAVKCSPEPKDVLCKRGGAGEPELTNYFCCCCGSTGNTFKRVEAKK